MHWWYYPDSYDSWIPSSEVDGSEAEEQPPLKGPWHVQARFIVDLEKFNEWPNELDYEVPDDMITKTVADRKAQSTELEYNSQGIGDHPNHIITEDSNIHEMNKKRKLNEIASNVVGDSRGHSEHQLPEEDCDRMDVKSSENIEKKMRYDTEVNDRTSVSFYGENHESDQAMVSKNRVCYGSCIHLVCYME